MTRDLFLSAPLGSLEPRNGIVLGCAAPKPPTPARLERRVLITAILDRFAPVPPRPGQRQEPART